MTFGSYRVIHRAMERSRWRGDCGTGGGMITFGSRFSVNTAVVETTARTSLAFEKHRSRLNFVR